MNGDRFDNVETKPAQTQALMLTFKCSTLRPLAQYCNPLLSPSEAKNRSSQVGLTRIHIGFH